MAGCFEHETEAKCCKMAKCASVSVSEEGLCFSEPVASFVLLLATDSHITSHLHYMDQPFNAAHDVTCHNCITHLVCPKYKVYKTLKTVGTLTHNHFAFTVPNRPA